MAVVDTLEVKLSLSAGAFDRAASSAASKLVNLSAKLEAAGVSANKLSADFGALAGPLSAFGAAFTGVATVAAASSIKIASDFEQTGGLIERVFGEGAASVEQFSKQLSSSSGLGIQDIRLGVAELGATLKSSLGDASAAQTQSQALTQLAGDLAAIRNIPFEDALERLKSGLLGETQAVEKLGINLLESNLKQEALRQGITKSTEKMTEQEKTLLRLSLIYKQTTDFQGAAAGEADTFAGAMARAGGAVQNLQIKLGDELLPLVTPLIQGFTDFAKSFLSLEGSTLKAGLLLTGFVGGVALLTGGLLAALPLIASVSTAMSTLGITAAIAASGGLAASAAAIAAIALPVAAVVAGLAAIKSGFDLIEQARAQKEEDVTFGVDAKKLSGAVTEIKQMQVALEAIKKSGNGSAESIAPLVERLKTAEGTFVRLKAKISGVTEESVRQQLVITEAAKANEREIQKNKEGIDAADKKAKALKALSEAEAFSAKQRDLLAARGDLVKDLLGDTPKAIGELGFIDNAAKSLADQFAKITDKVAGFVEKLRDAKGAAAGISANFSAEVSTAQGNARTSALQDVAVQIAGLPETNAAIAAAASAFNLSAAEVQKFAASVDGIQIEKITDGLLDLPTGAADIAVQESEASQFANRLAASAAPFADLVASVDEAQTNLRLYALETDSSASVLAAAQQQLTSSTTAELNARVQASVGTKEFAQTLADASAAADSFGVRLDDFSPVARASRAIGENASGLAAQAIGGDLLGAASAGAGLAANAVLPGSGVVVSAGISQGGGLIAEVFQKIADGAPSFKKAIDLFNQQFTEVGKAIDPIIASILPALRFGLGTITESLKELAFPFREIGKSLSVIFLSLVKAARPVFFAFANVAGKVILALVPAFELLAKIIVQIAPALIAVATALEAVSFAPLIAAIAVIAAPFIYAAALIGVFSAVISVVVVAFQVLQKVAQKVVEALAPVGAAIDQFFAPAVKTVSDAFNFIGSTVEGVASDLVLAFNLVAGGLESFLGPVLSVFNEFASQLTEIFGVILDFIKPVTDAVKEVSSPISDAVDGISAALADGADFIAGIFGADNKASERAAKERERTALTDEQRAAKRARMDAAIEAKKRLQDEKLSETSSSASALSESLRNAAADFRVEGFRFRSQDAINVGDALPAQGEFTAGGNTFTGAITIVTDDPTTVGEAIAREARKKILAATGNTNDGLSGIGSRGRWEFG